MPAVTESSAHESPHLALCSHTDLAQLLVARGGGLWLCSLAWFHKYTFVCECACMWPSERFFTALRCPLSPDDTCRYDVIPSWAPISTNRSVKNLPSIFFTDGVNNGGMLLWTQDHVLMKAECFRSCYFAPVVKCKVNIDFDCLWFVNQQVCLMFAFIGYGKQ